MAPGAAGSPSVCISRFAQANIATAWVRSEDPEIGQALRAQRRGVGRPDRRGIARQPGGIVEDRLAARIERGLDPVVPDAFHHLRRPGQLGEAFRVHGGAIGAARLALHPDDPPMSPVLGLARIMRSVAKVAVRRHPPSLTPRVSRR
jgi:hypothetical protein